MTDNRTSADVIEAAREMLAAEWARAGFGEDAIGLLGGAEPSEHTECALRAIQDALATQPAEPEEPTEEMWEAAWEASQDYFVGDATTKEGFRRGLSAMRATRIASPEAEFEVHQDDMMVAGCSGPRARALAEAMHYAAVYGEDGPVEVFEVRRIPVPAASPQGAAGSGEGV